MTASEPRSTTALIVLDGFGYREAADDNAISAARAPTWRHLMESAPHTLISGSGLDVGLPGGQMGNSEVGHMNLGAGRVVYQELTRINRDLETGAFAANAALEDAIRLAAEGDRAIHVLGLLSPGGVHSHEEHILAFLRTAAAGGARRLYVHAFLDGRDTPPRSAEPSLRRTDEVLAELGVGRVASIVGRYFAMDRDGRWDRVERAYDLLTRGEAPFRADTAEEGLAAAYARDESDEFVQPTTIRGPAEPAVHIEDGDVVVFMNFRADRAREITRALVEPAFDGFERHTRPALGAFVMLTRYADDIGVDDPVVRCAYEPQSLHNTLGEYLADRGATQLRIAETEKYAHVTFFFNGGRETPFEGEDRIMVPSPKVATYDLQPEMSAAEVTDRLVEAIRARRYDLVVCNYANGDMVGHTGNFPAAVQAVETLDACLARIIEALEETGGQCLITADHGNVEQMSDAGTGQAHTAHTSGPVPLVYVGPRHLRLETEGGTLADVAPTLLALMDVPQPEEMTGRSLAGPDA
ncbi:MAG TPA: 2,3-bisphosphoglycerate-independent phosphoglycerate mutase [Pseudomonadales bacterium]|nr:2,3-bisphosphoglycerate-independent phosphoglycerate mutase [Pseudomonadales bacterium]